MDIKEALLQEHSKRQTIAIANYIGNNSTRFNALMKLVLGNEPLLVQRGYWVLGYCAEDHPGLFKNHIEALLEHLSKVGIHNAVKRNTLKVFQFIKVPDKMLGAVVDICFGYLYSASEAIAVKSLSINLLIDTCMRYPELKEELIPLLHELSTHEAPAILARTRNGIALLNKQIKKQTL